VPTDRRDIAAVSDSGSFKFRAAALITRGGLLLLAGTRYEGNRYLPGGKVRLGEDSRTALARELREETSLELQIGDLLHVVEVLRAHADGRARHELMLVYAVPWPDRLPAQAATSNPLPGHRLTWVPSGELESKRFQPRQLAAALAHSQPSDTVRHTVIDTRPEPSAP
jgi:8-oxo-dGTP pyrophosphatase MutT (NUDIX family)